MRWSVALAADGDRELTREEIVELADAIAGHGGIAAGIGTPRYGAQLMVEAASMDEAVALATAAFRQAVARAALPPWPISHVEAVSEDQERAAIEANQAGWEQSPAAPGASAAPEAAGRERPAGRA
ncbi:MAG: hypothetical protein IRZ08_21400 [Frankia sp.]|nr:hypothetical protein [Frankia sp.]